VRCFTCGFTLPIIINILLGLFATFFVRGNNRSTYDIALAYDYANTQWFVILLSIIILIICVYIVCKKLIQIYNSL
jgi:p-aminobenzoyl-glutamate transporter AbgT